MPQTIDSPPADAVSIPADLQNELLGLSEDVDSFQQQHDIAAEKRLSLKHQIGECRDRMNDILREVRGEPLLNPRDDADDGDEGDTPPLQLTDAAATDDDATGAADYVSEKPREGGTG